MMSSWTVGALAGPLGLIGESPIPCLVLHCWHFGTDEKESTLFSELKMSMELNQMSRCNCRNPNR